MHQNAQWDWDIPSCVPLFRFATLLDDDRAGREAAHYLVTDFSGCARWRDVFLVKRQYPTAARDPKTIAKGIEELNTIWKGHDCEIEDLLPDMLIDEYSRINPNCFDRPFTTRGGRRHYELADEAKGDLCRFIEEKATADDLSEIINLLKALRYCLGVSLWQGTPI